MASRTLLYQTCFSLVCTRGWPGANAIFAQIGLKEACTHFPTTDALAGKGDRFLDRLSLQLFEARPSFQDLQ